MVIAEVVHVFLGDGLLVLSALLEGEVLRVAVLLKRREAVLEAFLGVLGGFFDRVGPAYFAVILLGALDLEAADGVEVIRVPLLLLEGVVVRCFLWMAVMLFRLFGMVRGRCCNWPCLLRFLEFRSVGVGLVLGLATCAVSHRFNLNTQRYITLRLFSRFYHSETTGKEVLECSAQARPSNGTPWERVGQSKAGRAAKLWLG